MYNLFEKAKIRQHSFNTTKAYVLADQGATELLRIEVEENINFNAQTAGRFQTPIGVAASRGNERDVELLLRKGGDPRSKAAGNVTALELAAKRGYTNVVRTLLENGAKPESKREQACLLHWAIKAGRTDTVMVLLDHGIDVNARIWLSNGIMVGTALQRASAAGQKDIVEILVSRGADINRRGGEYGSPLHAASCNGHLDIVELLLKHKL